MIVGMRNNVVAKTGYTARDYVQSGLIAMWDGIENAGWGVHNPTATVWKDLSGNGFDLGTNVFTEYENWTNDSFLFKFGGVNIFTSQDFPQDSFNSTWSVETVVKVADGSIGGLGGICGSCGDGKVGISFQCRSSSGIKLGVEGSSGVFVDLGVEGFRKGEKQTLSLCVSNGTGTGYVDSRYVNDRNGMSYLTHVGFIVGGDYANKGEYLATKKTEESRRFCGDVYCIRVYNKTISSDDVAANYAVDKARFNLP